MDSRNDKKIVMPDTRPSEYYVSYRNLHLSYYSAFVRSSLMHLVTTAYINGVISGEESLRLVEMLEGTVEDMLVVETILWDRITAYNESLNT